MKAYAMLSPKHQATLSSGIDAQVLTIPVKDAQAFEKGQVLMTLDCRQYEAELQKAQATENSSAVSHASAKELEALESGSKVEVAHAKAEHQKAIAAVNGLSALVEYCTVKAPFNGKVDDIMIHAHESVSRGQPLLKIVNNSEFEVKMFVPSTWLSWLKVGSSFNVHFDEINQSYTGHVTKLGAQVDAASQTIKVFGTLNHPGKSLVAGLSGEAYFARGADL